VKKTYELNWNSSFFITIQLDHEKDIEQIFKEMNDYWSRSEERLLASNGNIFYVGLKLIAERAFYLIVQDLISVEELSSKIKDEDGFWDVDEKQGIKIIDCHWRSKL
jgi:hypothetical protein